MSSPRGRELDPRSPEYQWVASVIRAVERRTGQPTWWNGRIYEEVDPDALATTHADGSVSVSQADVLAPARHAYTSRQVTTEDNRRARDAIATVTHEAVHLTSRYGDPNAPGAHPTHDDPGKALEEGLAEAWTHRNLNRVIRDLDMDQVVPGVIGPPTDDANPADRAAADSLLDGMATNTGRSRAAITQQLMSIERAQRWNAVADLAIDRHLSGLMPEARRADIRQRLANSLRADFARAHQIEESATLHAAAKANQGWHVGQQAVNNLDLEVSRIEQHYRDWYRANQVSPPGVTQQPPQRGSRPPESGQQQAGPASRRPRAPAAAEREAAHLRGVLSGQAPAANAPNVGSGQAAEARARGGNLTPGRQAEVTRPRSDGPSQHRD